MLKWPTPRWGEGFPGWHLECSAMALRHLGPRFDIHTGGIDNVFPHHEDEIAQSAPIVGGPPARVWVHGEFLQVGGQKMAKSAGNIERIADVAERGIDPLAFRYLCLTLALPPQARVHGRVARRGGRRARVAPRRGWRRSVRRRRRDRGPRRRSLRAGAAPDRPLGTADGVAGNGDGSGRRADRPGPRAGRSPLPGRRERSTTASSPRSTTTSTCRRRSRSSARSLRADLPADERRWLVLDADFVLGLDLDRAGLTADPTTSLPDEIRTLAERTCSARAARDYDRADALRNRPRGARLRRDRRNHRTDDPSRLVRRRPQPAARSRRLAEAVDDPVEVPLAQPVALRLRNRGPAAVLVAGRRDRNGDGAARRAFSSPSSRRTRLHQMSRFR